jgi:hypothetical protein
VGCPRLHHEEAHVHCRGRRRRGASIKASIVSIKVSVRDLEQMRITELQVLHLRRLLVLSADQLPGETAVDGAEDSTRAPPRS